MLFVIDHNCVMQPKDLKFLSGSVLLQRDPTCTEPRTT